MIHSNNRKWFFDSNKYDPTIVFHLLLLSKVNDIVAGIRVPSKLKKKLEDYYEYTVNSESDRANTLSALGSLLPQTMVRIMKFLVDWRSKVFWGN